jgi:uncharacterized protein (DUF1800 family)
MNHPLPAAIRRRSASFALIALPFLPAVAACGGGSGPAGATPAAGSLEPLGREPTVDEIRHLLRRTTFGAPPAEVARVQQIGLDAWLDEQLTIAGDTPVERAAEALILDPREPRVDEVAKWWLFLMERNPNGLQECLAFFWHDHFATSQNVLDDATRAHFVRHVNLLRRQGMGNVKELAYELAIDPAMLVWLDGVSSTVQGPNENFAREFWEVFTLGRNRGYTEDDIAEASRAFTGYRKVVDRNTGEAFFLFDPARHDDGPKTVFGITGNFGYREIVELTFQHRQAAEFLCERLVRHFAYDDPEPALVAGLARILRDHGYELRPVLRALFASNAFFSARARSGRVKMPAEYVVGFTRTTGLELPIGDLYESMILLNQVPTSPPSVFGWPEGTAWLGAQSLLMRGAVLNDVLSAREQHTAQGVSLAQLLPPPGARSADEVVGALAALLQVTLTAAESQQLAEFLGTSARTQNGQLVLEPSVFDGDDTRQVDERVRALLFLLSQHPTYQLR